MLISCEDILGNKYEIDESQFIKGNRVYGIHIKGREILLVQDIYADFWELPGGGVEPGEEIKEGLTREFREETGLRVLKIGKLVHSFIGYFYHYRLKQAWKSHRYFYLVEVEVGELLKAGNSVDTKGANYFALKDLDTVSIKPAIREVISEALSNL